MCSASSQTKTLPEINCSRSTVVKRRVMSGRTLRRTASKTMWASRASRRSVTTVNLPTTFADRAAYEVRGERRTTVRARAAWRCKHGDGVEETGYKGPWTDSRRIFISQQEGDKCRIEGTTESEKSRLNLTGKRNHGKKLSIGITALALARIVWFFRMNGRASICGPAVH